MRIDWQMYEDGQLSPEEMQEANRMLEENESARHELEGLRKFRKQVRQAAMNEPVPEGRLTHFLNRVAGEQTSRPVRRWQTVAVAAAVLALGALAYFFRAVDCR